MFLKRLLSHSKKEREVIDNMREHIKLLCMACDCFKTALENHDRDLMRTISDLEREGDSLRRQIISDIYEGAFLPYLRPDLCRFVEIVDGIFDLLQDTAYHYLETKIHEQIIDECIRVAFFNSQMCQMLLITFDAMLNGKDLREKTLAVRIYEKKIDDIKFDLLRTIKTIDIADFWEGKGLSDFISSLTSISDVIEDSSDHLQIINVSLR
jgi:predicted phosphate transport protein (TIGR00153 family)